jgi:hypothetical protein
MLSLDLKLDYSIVEHRSSELVTKVVQIIENSDIWIKFLSMKKHYYNVLYYYNKNYKTFKTGETQKINKCNYKLTFSNTRSLMELSPS